MASTSSISNPLVVKVKDMTHLVFKESPLKSIEDDLVGAFYFIPHGVLHIDDVRAYIHYEIEEIGLEDILDLYTDHERYQQS